MSLHVLKIPKGWTGPQTIEAWQKGNTIGTDSAGAGWIAFELIDRPSDKPNLPLIGYRPKVLEEIMKPVVEEIAASEPGPIVTIGETEYLRRR